MTKKILLLSCISFLMFSCKKGNTINEVNETTTVSSISKDSVVKEKSIVETVDSAKELAVFVPENYSILDSLACDLNQDGKDDYILILKHNDEEKLSNVIEHPEKRPMYLLIRNDQNQLQIKYKNDNVVLCVDCGGVMGDPYQAIVFKNGYFSVEHYGGSNWRWTNIVTFKYSKEKNDWFLHKIGVDTYHTSDPENVETEVKTTKDFGQIRFADYNGYQEE